MPKVSAAEWRWVTGISLIILVAFSVPYIVGFLVSTPQMSFSGFLFGLEDMYSYIAKMRYGARDGWAFQLIYTSEPHQGGYVFLPFLGLGKLVAFVTGQGGTVTADALIAAYHVARVVCGGLLLGAVYLFLAEFLAEVSQRRLAWCVAMLSGGLGWFSIVLNPIAGVQPIEFYIPEAFSTLLLFGLPHLALARALLLVGWLALWRAMDRKDWKWALGAGAAWLGMGLMVPFFVALLGVLLAVWLIALVFKLKRVPWIELRLVVVAGLLPLGLLIYNSLLFMGNPIFVIWAAQNNLPSPSPPAYLLAYGVLVGLAIPGALKLWRDGLTHRTLLLLIWPLVAAVLIYLPINVQRRLLEGMIVPLSALAVIGLWALIEERRRLVRLAAVVGVFVLLMPSTLLLISGEAAMAARAFWPIFHPADELLALRWLHEHAPDDSVVLSTRVSGSVLPAYAGVRVYLGHGPETVRAADKERQVDAFFSDEMTDVQRQYLLVEGRIDYVWFGRVERVLACTGENCFDPARLGLHEVYRQGDYMIYEVAP